jgi:hypothetical protein
VPKAAGLQLSTYHICFRRKMKFKSSQSRAVSHQEGADCFFDHNSSLSISCARSYPCIAERILHLITTTGALPSTIGNGVGMASGVVSLNESTRTRKHRRDILQKWDARQDRLRDSPMARRRLAGRDGGMTLPERCALAPLLSCSSLSSVAQGVDGRPPMESTDRSGWPGGQGLE